MQYAPIIVFAYNRPDHLEQTLTALAANDLAGKSELYVYCDGAREWGGLEKQRLEIDERGTYITKRYGLMYCSKEEYEVYLANIESTRQVAHQQTGFKEVHVVEREKNVGLMDNIVDGVSTIISQFGKVVVFEDDIISSPGTLRYFNDALEVYKEEERVMHISAYMYPHKSHLPETFFYPVPYPGGGWATWQRAWSQYNNDAQELFDYWKNNWKTFDIFGGNYLSKQLKRNREGTMRTWFVKWYAVMRRQDALALYPGRSLTNNIGFDGSATNCHTTSKFDVVPTDYVKVKSVPLSVNRKATRLIYDFYQGHWYNKRRRNALIKKVKDTILFWK